VPVSPAVGVRLDPELLQRVDDVARAEHRTRSNLVQRATQMYVEQAERDEDDPQSEAVT
jgi:metal-responsive CopG/Arc/MetJ family transcriptional regulator